jgi:hypothetical protein
MVKTLDPNELDPTQGEPEGETVLDPGNEAPEPEQETELAEQPEGGEQPETPEEPKPEEQPKPEKKKTPWELRRINEETNKRREAEKRLAEAEAELKRLRAPKPVETSEEPERLDVEAIRAQERDRIRLEEAGKIEAERFNAACNQTYEKGVAAFGADFDNATATLSQALGDEMQKRPEFLQAITELDNGHQVYYELSRNPEEAERLLRMPPVKMALEIAKMSANVTKPAPKPISKAPAPVAPVGGAAKPTIRLEDDIPMDQWADKYLRELKSKM